MATFEQIFGYEVQIETAWQDLLDAAYQSSADLSVVKVFTQASDAQKNTPYVDVELRRVSGLKQKRLDPLTKATYETAWTGHLVARVVTTRGKNSNRHNDILAIARAQFAQWQALLDLPFHTVQQMDDFDSVRGVHPTTLAEFTEAEYKMQFTVDPTAWP